MKYKYLFSRNKLNQKIKYCVSEDYNYAFNAENGQFLRWGKTYEDNPEYSKLGPEILDVEVSEICPRACSWCYKSNTANGKYMTLETFKKLFAKFPRNLTQIAFGIGSLDGCPELFDIMHYCRENPNNRGVVPNITINGDNLTDEYAKKLSEVCGAVAVSMYDYDTCFDAVKKLTDLGMKQVNIHCLLAQETYVKCLRVLCEAKTDKRLEKLNSIVYLWLKPKGKRNTYRQLKYSKDYEALVKMAFDYDIKIGFDSCSASTFLKAIKERKDFKRLEEFVESCESTAFSYYLNVDGIGYPCSFIEGQENYKGVDVLNAGDFINDVWNAEETKKFREKLLTNKNEMNCRECPEFKLGCEVSNEKLI